MDNSFQENYKKSSIIKSDNNEYEHKNIQRNNKRDSSDNESDNKKLNNN